MPTGAFSSVDAGRGVDFDTADDASALVALDIVEPVQTGDGSTLVTVTNNTTGPLAVELTLTAGTDPGVSLPGDQQQKQILPDQSATFSVDVDAAQAPDRIEFALDAVGTGAGSLSVSLSRATTVEETGPCSGPRRVIDQDPGDNVDDDGTVVIAAGLTINGGVTAGGCVILRDGAQVEGDISAGGQVRLGENARGKGDVEAGGDVSFDRNARIEGDIEDSDDVTLGENARVKGGIKAGGDVSFDRNARAEGDVNSEANVTLGKNARIKGGIEASGDVMLGKNARVEGDVKAGGGVTLGKNARIKGEIESGSD